jgi:hypothetical protein
MEPARSISALLASPTESRRRDRYKGQGVGEIKRPSRSRHTSFAALMLLCVSPFLTGCAANSYAGISLAPGAADPELQELARRAQAGDQHAQLELGIRYEEGLGVPVEFERADRLYRLAARDSGGTIYVYTPPVGERGQGRVIPLKKETQRRGLAEARSRLLSLQRRHVQR